MLLRPLGGTLAQSIEKVLEALPGAIRSQVTSETHSAAVELATRPHGRIAEAVTELDALRGSLGGVLSSLDLAAGVAGTHPFAVWQEMVVASGARHQEVMGSVRALARREPTFALHVHVGLPDPELGMVAANRMRAHLPMLLALSANSPYWQGRDTGLASARTPLFQAFPRVGIPRAFPSYRDWVDAVNLLIETDAFPEPTYLWWDVRAQPRFGTVEIRIMDAQTSLARTAALAAFVQCLVRLEATGAGHASGTLLDAPEILAENRFLATRDGVLAALVDPVRRRRIPLQELVGELLDACAPHAEALGCAGELAGVPGLMREGGDARQRRLASERGGLGGLVEALTEEFLLSPPVSSAAWPPSEPASP
jgi:carboxylate-amine ligase